MDRTVIGPRPSTELRPAIVSEGLLDFCGSVHHERAVLCDRLADRTALQDQTLDRGFSVQRHGDLFGKHRAGVCSDRVVPDH